MENFDKCGRIKPISHIHRSCYPQPQRMWMQSTNNAIFTEIYNWINQFWSGNLSKTHNNQIVCVRVWVHCKWEMLVSTFTCFTLLVYASISWYFCRSEWAIYINWNYSTVNASNVVGFENWQIKYWTSKADGGRMRDWVPRITYSIENWIVYDGW